MDNAVPAIWYGSWSQELNVNSNGNTFILVIGTAIYCLRIVGPNAPFDMALRRIHDNTLTTTTKTTILEEGTFSIIQNGQTSFRITSPTATNMLAIGF